jgi:hypothetical protein
MCLQKTNSLRGSAFQPLLGKQELKTPRTSFICDYMQFWEFLAILTEFLCSSRKSVGYSINCLNNAEINRYSNKIIP